MKPQQSAGIHKPRAGQELADLIDERTVEAELWHPLEQETAGEAGASSDGPSGRVRCTACGHRCNIAENRRGICQVRFNRGGKLYAPHGYVAGLQCDPIEKKPWYHVAPGRDALTFGMLGCDFHCAFCQNWLTSQALREDASGTRPQPITADGIVDLAVSSGARALVSSYNEPLITAEWAAAVFRRARERGGTDRTSPDYLVTGFVSNGNATPEVLDYLRPFTDVYKIDLKGFNDKRYRKLGGTLENVLTTIRGVYERGFWTEIVTLVISGFNDSEAELRQMAEFIASVSVDIPWHVTAFHPDFNMTDTAPTTAEDLQRAAAAGHAAGLNYVYGGNMPGRVGDLEHTVCPSCGKHLVERTGFRIHANHLVVDASTGTGSCPDCHKWIPGIWA